MSQTPMDETRYHALALISQINQAERDQWRRDREALKEARRTLLRVAYCVAGKAIDDLRRADPFVPDKWSLDEWERFFASHAQVPPAERRGSASANPKLEQRCARLEAENKQLTQAIDDLQLRLSEKERAIQQHLEQIAALDRALTQHSAQLPLIGSLSIPSRADTGVSTVLRDIADITSPAMPTVAARAAASLEEISEEQMTLMSNPSPTPPGFEHRLPRVDVDRVSSNRSNIEQKYETHRRWQTLALYILGRHGISMRSVIVHLIRKALGVKPSSKWAAILDCMADAPGEFITITKLSMWYPLATTAVLYRLTPEGRALYRAFGWGEPVESDWERLIRLHQGDREEMEKHSLGMLVFANHARLRGWRVSVLPDTGDRHHHPDVLVERDGEQRYVEVEMTDKDLRLDKWRSLVRRQGYIAVCASTPEMRRNIVAHCETAGAPVVGTDLQTLIDGMKSRTDDNLLLTDPLWVAS